jgi:asparagine synthase (glutamine-hydrolysing)
MCGIAGYCGDFEPSLLAAMRDAIGHRGPDGEGSYLARADEVGLAHRRLAIIDLSASGAQPMTDAATGVTIVFNGEIYNYRELRSEMLSRGIAFLGHSDTEVILRNYLVAGDSVLGQLNGIFALAIWDPRERTLLIARDGAGVKPLYVAHTSKGLLFASELKALLACPEVSRDIDPEAVWSYLTYLWAPTPQTMLKAVRKLEPGYALQVRGRQVVRKWCFHRLPYPAPKFAGGVEDARAALRAGLQTAVTRQMVADVEVGAFLSGGLDSSAIVALAKGQARHGRLACFTIETTHSTAEEGFADDLPYAERVAAHLGVDLHRVRVGPEIVDRFAEMIWHLDEPQADLAPLNALLICELARSHGIKVLLSGAGGDDLFTGYRRHYALMQERWWNWMPHPLRVLLGSAARALPAGRTVARRIRKALSNAALNGDDRLVSYFHWLPPTEGLQLLADSHRKVAARYSPTDPLLHSLGSIGDERDPLNRMLFLEAKHFLCDHNLNYTDKMGMAVGVEVRVPFLDPDLVAFAAGLPASFKQHGREGKWIFKRAMEGILPSQVIYRPKSGFGVPLRRWLRNELRPVVDELLSPVSLERRGLFDPRAVGRLREADAAGRIDAAYPILALCSIETWCRLFIDRPALASSRI